MSFLPLNRNTAATTKFQRTYLVTVRTETEQIQFAANADASADLHMRAIDQFGTCGVTVTSA